ncbi:hypothetical protein OHC33_004516 [Knufia fluminis]|uniref:Uncharacterized protein n=1 Tax=Knufia fluminis TaxID=191047 RepID=A0AAN8EIJ1_9EURO|nr:hypothetical protein OHC33_004516 [Knufia fluminis]
MATKKASRKIAFSAPRRLTRRRAILPFLQLPAELRNMMYQILFPPGAHFTISQRMADVDDEVPKRYARPPPAARRHDMTSSATEFWRFVGILGTNKQVRQEALSVLEHNVRGTFDIMIAMNFRLLPSYVLGLIEKAVLRRHIIDSAKSRYFLRFPNLKRAVLGTYVVHQTDLVPGHPLRYVPATMHESYLDSIREYYDGQDPCSDSFHLCPDDWRLPANDAVPATPKRWDADIGCGVGPVSIEMHVYVVDVNARPGSNAHEGVLVVYDWNPGRVTSVKLMKFCRLRDDEVPAGFERHGHDGAWSPAAWLMLDSV